MKEIAILGSTGSIGRQALEVISLFPERFRVRALAAGRNIELLEEQIRTFSPKKVAVGDRQGASSLRGRVGVEVLWGEEGLMELVREEGVDLVVMALSGAIAFKPTLEAIRAGKDLALATKEVLVMGGEVVISLAKRKGVRILPIDSEHSALFQILQGRKGEEVRRVILTASGGPFYGRSPEETEGVTPEEALRHPVWRMGPKISVDSATLMNKGLEVIEAHWLFDIPASKIQVFIHPQGIVHGMVELLDGVILAHMSSPDMRIPIAYALSYPERLPLPFPPVGPERLSGLLFEEVDPEKIPALRLAYWALEAGGTMPAVLNASDEVAVEAFLKGRIGFNRIVQVVEEVMEEHRVCRVRAAEDVLEADRWAREVAKKKVERDR